MNDVNIKHMKLKIYENYDSGQITESEKNELMEILNEYISVFEFVRTDTPLKKMLYYSTIASMVLSVYVGLPVLIFKTIQINLRKMEAKAAMRANEDLMQLNNEITKGAKGIKEKDAELKKIIQEYKSKSGNKNVDPESLKDTVNKYMKARSDVKMYANQIKKIRTRFIQSLRKSGMNQAEFFDIQNTLDKLMSNIENINIE